MTRGNKKSHRYTTYPVRFWSVVGVLIVITLGLIARMVDLTVLHSDFLKGQGDARTLRVIDIPAHRGMIVDRNGQPLAISTPVDSVWINPEEFDLSGKDLPQLARLLEMTPQALKQRAQKNRDKEFVYLKRGLEPALGEKIKALDIEGVYLRREYHRFYPAGEMAAQVVGFTNIDDQGQEGLELAYQPWLSGQPGRKRVVVDLLGHVVSEVNVITPPRSGQHLVTSFDTRLQYLAYHELQDSVKKAKAEGGVAIVLDVKTGEVLAMVNTPSFNPNRRPGRRDARYRNRAVTDAFEPGSTIKTFSMISALKSGKVRVNSRVNTSPGWMKVEDRRIEDEHNNGVIDMTSILKLSSNVGISRVTLLSPPEVLSTMLRDVGFGQVTDSGFPGENSGFLARASELHPFTLATLSFGYGISVTPLQLAQAYSVLANEGVKRPISLLRVDKPSAGVSVLNPTIAREVRGMLEAVISQGGTAPLARVEGYRVTGKTGTARLLGPHGYIKGRYNSSFVGMAPASDPRLLVAVVIYDVHSSVYYGGVTAGPAFSRIMSESLRLLGVSPDDLNHAASVKSSDIVMQKGDDA